MKPNTLLNTVCLRKCTQLLHPLLVLLPATAPQQLQGSLLRPCLLCVRIQHEGKSQQLPGVILLRAELPDRKDCAAPPLGRARRRRPEPRGFLVWLRPCPCPNRVLFMHTSGVSGAFKWHRCKVLGAARGVHECRTSWSPGLIKMCLGPAAVGHQCRGKRSGRSVCSCEGTVVRHLECGDSLAGRDHGCIVVARSSLLYGSCHVLGDRGVVDICSDNGTGEEARHRERERASRCIDEDVGRQAEEAL